VTPRLRLFARRRPRPRLLNDRAREWLQLILFAVLAAALATASCLNR